MWLPLLAKWHERGRPLDPALKSRVLVEQLDVALRLAPFTVLVSLGVVQVISYLFWTPERWLYVALLEALLLPLAAYALAGCWRWRTRPKPDAVTPAYVRTVTGVAIAYGTLLATIPVVLFAGTDQQLRLLIAATCAGLIATGMTASVMPRTAIGYSGPIIAGSFVGLALTGEAFHIHVGILLLFYAAFICFTILHLSRLLTMRVMAQADLERQREFTNLLLNDFEENASDWLWETDSELRLQHISARLVQVAGLPEGLLQGLPLERLFMPSPAPWADRPGGALWASILRRQAFSNLLLPLDRAGETRWWLVSGKPILDASGGFAGYRGVGSDITERKRSEERLSYLAMHDSLTELPNRLSFQQGLEAATQRLFETECFAVLCLDLDEFKSINDTFGHAAGDTLLRMVADRLRLAVGPEPLLARLAGDEFAILCEGRAPCAHPALAALAMRIVDSLAAPFQIEDIRLNVGVSIGIAVAPLDGCQEIMRRADLAMYRMKGEGRNGFRFYEAEMDQRIEARRALTANLRGALDRNEFALYFQPFVGAQDGRTQGFEALLRWQHPVLGFVSPGEFIPLAEETGVIIPLGEWIVHEACRIAAVWPAPLSVAVNLSPVQFRHSDLPAIVRAALEGSGLTAERLELEVTESVFLEATPSVHATLRELRAMRVRLSLDDFGTGYSSLSYLRRIPFDKIKIDQSFVRELPHDQGDLAIVRAIVELAGSLGMTIIAEGVETEAQRQCLQQHGCHQLQGYLFSKPLSAGEALRLVPQAADKPKRSHAA